MSDADPTIIVEGDEQSLVEPVPTLPDAGVPPAVGVGSYCVFRASRDVPSMSDGRGWTYHHHVDMACWKGLLYVGWNSCEKDEDVWPSRELFSTSREGESWTEPREMFPQGVSTPLRMYFYRADNDRMLMIAGLRGGTDRTDEDLKGGLVVREICADHRLGAVYTLQSPPAITNRPPEFSASSDEAFVAACRQLLADSVFLEQQDRGRLLGNRAMKWHHASAWPGGKVPGDSDKWVSGKAFSFFRRKDGVLVGVSKMGWTTMSSDGGQSWAQPSVPTTLVTGKAKVWSQRTSDGRYALVYNPTARTRYPLVVVTGDDGTRFAGMRIIQGELPIQRYAGADRSIGPQYVRGLSQWSDDGSRAGDHAMWLVYSMNKEDIWVSRVPLPVKPDATSFDEPWNVHCPKWANVAIEKGGNEIRIEDRDPFDYVRLTRLFPRSTRVKIGLTIEVIEATRASLEVEVLGGVGSGRPIRLIFGYEGRIHAIDGSRAVTIGACAPHEPVRVEINADAARGRYGLTLDEKVVLDSVQFAEPCDGLARLSLRTGAWRGIGGKNPVPEGTDVPAEPIVYRVSDVSCTAD